MARGRAAPPALIEGITFKPVSVITAIAYNNVGIEFPLCKKLGVFNN
jgi:hypothetical protein